MKTKLHLLLLAAALVSSTANLLGQEPTPLLTQSADKLLAVLKSDAPRKAKADACRELGVIGGKEAVPTLVEMLASEEMNHMARYALETMPDKEVSDALRAQLPKLKGRPLIGVIGSLGVRKDPLAVEPLAGFLANSDVDVVRAAARAIGSIGTVAAKQALITGFDSAPREAFLAFAEGFGRVAEALAAQGNPGEALDIYGQNYNNTEMPHQVRAEALLGAILTRRADGVGLLREALSSGDYILFAAAIRASQSMSDRSVTDALCAELPKLPADNQVVILQTLGLRGDASATSAVADASKSANKPVRLAAIRSLAQLGSDSAVQTLLATMNDGDKEVAAVAKESLASVPGAGVDGKVVAMLSGADTAQRLTGIELIGRRRMIGSLPLLIKATSDADAKIRAASVRQVGELGGVSELPTLVSLLVGAKSSSDTDAAEQALGVLVGKLPDAEGSATVLASQFGSAPPAAKSALLNVLASLSNPGALKAVRNAAGDGDAEVRASAIRALSAWKTSEAAPALLSMSVSAGSDSEKVLALRGYLGLAANGDLPAAERLNMCKSVSELIKRDQERKQWLAALGAIPATDAVTLIVPYLDNAGTKEEATAACVTIAEKLLQRQGQKEAAAALIEPLGKAAQATSNAELGKRANALLEQAKKRAQ